MRNLILYNITNFIEADNDFGRMVQERAEKKLNTFVVKRGGKENTIIINQPYEKKAFEFINFIMGKKDDVNTMFQDIMKP